MDTAEQRVRLLNTSAYKVRKRVPSDKNSIMEKIRASLPNRFGGLTHCNAGLLKMGKTIINTRFKRKQS